MTSASPFRLQIAVIGGSACTEMESRLAYAVGAGLARARATLICGGRGGIMEAAARGAHDHGGRTVGILPGIDARNSPPNASIDIAIFTDMGQARNAIVVQSVNAVIAIGGEWGTLSEIALARKADIPVITLQSWQPRTPIGEDAAGLQRVMDAEEAVRLAIASASRERLG